MIAGTFEGGSNHEHVTMAFLVGLPSFAIYPLIQVQSWGVTEEFSL